MPSSLELEGKSSVGQGVIVCLLLVGLFFPTSTNGVHSELCVLMAFAILNGLLLYLAFKHGTRRGAVIFIALPLLIILTACTLPGLLRGTSEFDWGTCVKFCSLAILLSLNLKGVRAGRSLDVAFFIANVANMICGAAVLLGSQWISDFLPKYYWSFYPELVPTMVALHKPVLTLGTHASAAFFFYVFFWVNWEAYKRRRIRSALFFAFGYFILLLGLTSFSSVGFSVVALVQMTAWCWRNQRKLFFAIVVFSTVVLTVSWRALGDQFEDWTLVTGLGSKFFNLDTSGPLARYGGAGLSRGAADYMLNHPLSQIGFGTPPDAAGGPAALGDSGPVEYLLRGSFPVLFLMYFGLYRFLRSNLVLPVHAVALLVTMIAFESAFSLLIYVRSLYLLPFLVIYLNGIALGAERQAVREGALVPSRPGLFGRRQSLGDVLTS